MSLTDHFTIGQRVRVLRQTDPFADGKSVGFVRELDENNYSLAVSVLPHPLYSGKSPEPEWFGAHEIIDAGYRSLDAWMRDSDYHWAVGDPEDPSPGWYDEDGRGAYIAPEVYAAAIGAA